MFIEVCYHQAGMWENVVFYGNIAASSVQSVILQFLYHIYFNVVVWSLWILDFTNKWWLCDHQQTEDRIETKNYDATF